MRLPKPKRDDIRVVPSTRRGKAMGGAVGGGGLIGIVVGILALLGVFAGGGINYNSPFDQFPQAPQGSAEERGARRPEHVERPRGLPALRHRRHQRLLGGSLQPGGRHRLPGHDRERLHRRGPDRLRQRDLRRRPVLLPGRPAGLPGRRVLPGPRSALPRAGRLRAGLRRRARDRPSRPERHRDLRPGRPRQARGPAARRTSCRSAPSCRRTAWPASGATRPTSAACSRAAISRRVSPPRRRSATTASSPRRRVRSTPRRGRTDPPSSAPNGSAAGSIQVTPRAATPSRTTSDQAACSAGTRR